MRLLEHFFVAVAVLNHLDIEGHRPFQSIQIHSLSPLWPLPSASPELLLPRFDVRFPNAYPIVFGYVFIEPSHGNGEIPR